MANGFEPSGGLVYELHAHAHNYPLETLPSNNQTNQAWDFVNPMPMTLLNGASLEAVEIQLANTGQCINFVANDNDNYYATFFLDSCDLGDPNEYF